MVPVDDSGRFREVNQRVNLCERQVSVFLLSSSCNCASPLKSSSIQWGTEETMTLLLLLLQNTTTGQGRTQMLSSPLFGEMKALF